MNTKSTSIARNNQKIIKLSDEERRKLKVASHKNFMNESELVRLLIEQAYQSTIKRDPDSVKI